MQAKRPHQSPLRGASFSKGEATVTLTPFPLLWRGETIAPAMVGEVTS
jgi:hypothetical protein